MADEKTILSYKGRPLMRKDNLVYYGSMADSHIVMLQILETKKVGEQGLRRAAADRSRRACARPDRQEEREGRLLYRAGPRLRLAGPRAEGRKKIISSVFKREEAAHTICATSFSFFHSSLARRVRAGRRFLTPAVIFFAAVHTKDKC